MNEDEVPVSEAYQVYATVSKAAREGRVTWLTEDGKRIAAIVPAEVAESALGAPGPTARCSACADYRHVDCSRHHPGPAGACGCDQRALHASILASQVQLHMAASRWR
jgi:antitoxin (DNA-binding transcriptional repressor) of toxin-antitoxin stability system